MRPVLFAVLILCAACGGQPPAMQMPAPQVGCADVLVRELPVSRDLTGRIDAVEVVELRPQVSGAVVSVAVKDGAMVAAGDIILQIDRAPLEAAVARTKAAVAQAEANVQLAVSTRDRNRTLLGDHVVAQQVYDDSVTTAEAAEAALAAARASLFSSQLDLGHAEVRAPISGRIGRVLTTVGNVVQGGGPAPATLLATLVSVDPVYATFDLDEETYHRLASRLADSAAGKTQVPVEVRLAGESGQAHPGHIAFVDNQIDAGSGSIRLRALIPDPGHQLIPGAFARIRLEIEPARPVVLVNASAVQAKLTTRYVLSVDATGTTAFRPVVLGPAHGDLREIASGLAAGDRVVVTNLAKIFFPGAKVQPQAVDMETLAPPAAAPAATAAPAAH